jgi:PAS domain-containing protein
MDLLKSVFEQAGQVGSDFDFEHRLLMPDRSIKYIRNLAHPVRYGDGHEETVGAVTDITERKLAEEAIRRSETYLAEAQRLSHTGSWVWKYTCPRSGIEFTVLIQLKGLRIGKDGSHVCTRRIALSGKT